MRDVISAFPLNHSDKENTYLLRFETYIQVAGRKVHVWQDTPADTDICVPHFKGKVRISALKYP